MCDSNLQKIIYSYFPRPYSKEKETCPVQIRNEKTKVIVTITEEDLTANNKHISDNFVRIALQIHRDLLPNISFRDVQWELHCLRDWMSDWFGHEMIYDVKIPESLRDTPRYIPKKIIASYTIRKLAKSDSELILGLGTPYEIREIRLPLERFPSLAPLSRDELRTLTNHKNGSVLYWCKFKEKLILRDAELFGDGTHKMKEDEREHDFLYQVKPTQDVNRI